MMTPPCRWQALEEGLRRPSDTQPRPGQQQQMRGEGWAGVVVGGEPPLLLRPHGGGKGGTIQHQEEVGALPLAAAAATMSSSLRDPLAARM